MLKAEGTTGRCVVVARRIVIGVEKDGDEATSRITAQKVVTVSRWWKRTLSTKRAALNKPTREAYARTCTKHPASLQAVRLG